MDRLRSVGLLVSRILLSGIFISSGVLKITAFAGTREVMARQGMKMTGLFLTLAILLELGGGLSVLSGYYPRLGALALVLFLLPVTLVFHRDLGDPAQVAHLLKNLAIMGGLVAILAAGGGEFSAGRKKETS